MEKRALGFEDLAAQSVLELPERALMSHGGTLIHIDVDVKDVVAVLDIIDDIDVEIEDVDVNLLTGDIDVEVGDVLSDNEVEVFCNQIITVLSAQCFEVEDGKHK